ncbi:MAG TPA: DUF2851 family protein [Lacunisphaera sp.]|jgi:hypothetical protein|nr:DUF2851 family protein [Lacunisphaera sp.]
MATTNFQVAEMQGLYGPFTIAERVVQKIWLRGDFARDRAVLADGRSLVIRSPGAWNLLGGPDFHGARLAIDGGEVTGDIEVHFHVADWRSHDHAADPAYNRVVLHVVLFPPAEFASPALDHAGREIPTLVLLPLLHRDLEEYVSDDALEALTSRDEWERFAELAALPPAERESLIRQNADVRWRQKVAGARAWSQRLGWTEAAHHLALDVLGYRRNRAAMLMVAARYPLPAWGTGVEPRLIYELGRGYWQTQGLRPANHPLTRLRQYRDWASARPDWPERLDAILAPVVARVGAGDSARAWRRECDLPRLRDRIAREVVAEAISGTRLDTLICDAFLPLVAARTGRELRELWFHWFLGDVPAQVRRALPRLGLAGLPDRPHSHGRGQGLLGWILAREAGASC